MVHLYHYIDSFMILSITYIFLLSFNRTDMSGFISNFLIELFYVNKLLPFFSLLILLFIKMICNK